MKNYMGSHLLLLDHKEIKKTKNTLFHCFKTWQYK